MTDTFRALCAEMLEAFDGLPCETNYKGQSRPVVDIDEELFARARAALAQPEPVAPTDEELNDTYWAAWHKHLDRTNSVLHSVGLRAILARWGTPANTINQEDYDRG